MINNYRTKLDIELAYTTNSLESVEQVMQCTEINVSNFSSINGYK